MISPDGKIVIHCDAPGCPASWVHAQDVTGLDDDQAAEALRAGHQITRAGALNAGWKPGPDGTLLCPASPDPVNYGVPTDAELAAQTDAAIAAILAEGVLA